MNKQIQIRLVLVLLAVFVVKLVAPAPEAYAEDYAPKTKIMPSYVIRDMGTQIWNNRTMLNHGYVESVVSAVNGTNVHYTVEYNNYGSGSEINTIRVGFDTDTYDAAPGYAYWVDGYWGADAFAYVYFVQGRAILVIFMDER